MILFVLISTRALSVRMVFKSHPSLSSCFEQAVSLTDVQSPQELKTQKQRKRGIDRERGREGKRERVGLRVTTTTSTTVLFSLKICVLRERKREREREKERGLPESQRSPIAKEEHSLSLPPPSLKRQRFQN